MTEETADTQDAAAARAPTPETKSQAQPVVQLLTDRAVVKTCLWAFPTWIRPNHLTVLRLLFVPVILVLLYFEHRGWALATFIVATLTDAIDGAMARTRHQTSVFGTYADPIADKLLVAAVLAWVGWPYFMDHRALGVVVPIFLAFMVLELIFTAVGVPLLVRARATQSSNLFGKAKMFAQSLALFLFLLAGMLDLKTLTTISAYLLWVGLGLAIVSGAMQVFDARRGRRQQAA